MKKRIVFTGGGTLGHVMPNIYLIKDLIGEYDCFYIGSNKIEDERIKDLNNELKVKNSDNKNDDIVAYYSIPTVKFNRDKILENIKIPFMLIKSIHRAKKVLKEIKPDVIFSKGGYVALPVCLAGRMLKIPIVAHESDSSFGLSNKIILKLCKSMCVNFKNLEGKNKKICYTGPIFSAEFQSNRKNKSKLNLKENLPTLLIVGGSLGSKKINDILMPIIKDLIKEFNVIHLTGKGNLTIKSFDNYNAIESTNDMVNLYNIADFILGRSGAGVTAECYYKKLPMLLIPLENKASRGDQLLNAKYYENLGVAKIIREADITPTYLLNELQRFYKNINNYKNIYLKLTPQNGKEKIIEIIKSLLDKTHN